VSARRGNRVRVIFGRKGSGKSYYIKGRVRREPRLIVWDLLSEYAGLYSDRPLRDATLVYSAAQLADLAGRRPLGRVVVQAPREEAPLVFRFARRAGDLTLVVDEVNLYCSPSGADPELLELLRLGRHARLDLYLAARRPAEVHRDVTAQADEITVFRTTESRDLDYFSRLAGQDFADRLTTLPRWHSTTWAP